LRSSVIWRWRWLVGVALAALAVYWVWHVHREQLGFDWHRFTATFLQVKLEWLLAASVLSILSFYGRALRWAEMMRPLGRVPRMYEIFSATAIGFTAIVLFGRPAELVRPYLISLRGAVPFTSQIAIWLLERIYDLLIVLILFGFGVAGIRQSGVEVGPRIEGMLRVAGYSVGILCALALGILFCLREFSEPMQRRLVESLAFLPEHWQSRVDQVAGSFVRGVASTKEHRALALVVFYSCIEWAIILLSYAALFQAIPAVSALSVSDILIFLGLVSFGSIVHLPGGGGGAQIASVVVLVELFRLPLEVASGITIFVWIVAVAVIVPVGAVMAVQQGLGWRRLKSMRQLEAL